MNNIDKIYKEIIQFCNYKLSDAEKNYIKLSLHQAFKCGERDTYKKEIKRLNKGI